MINDEIKNRILMEMNGVIGDAELRQLKMCLDRNFYGVTVMDNCTDIVKQDMITNETMLHRFIFEKRIEGLSGNTLSQYKRETLRFFSVINKHFKDITSDDINFYLATLMSNGISVNSVDNSRKFIKPFFKWLYENEHIKKDVFIKIKPIKRTDKQKDYLTENDIVKIRDVCQENKRALAIVDFLLSTGVRVSECSNLKLQNIDFISGEVNIYASKTNEWRKVYLDSNALKHLQDYINTRTDTCPYVFVNLKRTNGEITRMKNGSIQKIVQRYCKMAKIHKHCHVHLFRKTLATRLYKHGMELPIIAKILGHKTIKTTEKFYLTICDQDIKYLYHKCAV